MLIMGVDDKARLSVGVCSIFFVENSLIFRELTTSDFGIDAMIEEKVDNTPTGKYILAQIKCGESHIKEL